MALDEKVASAIGKVKSWEDLIVLERNIQNRGMLSDEAKVVLRQKATSFGRAYLTQRAEIDGETLTDAESRILDVIGEYWALQKRAGKPISRTLMQISSRGLIEAAEASVCRNRPTLGYQNLTDAGLEALSYEQIVVDFPDEFSPRAIWFSRRTLGLPNATDKPPASEDAEIHVKTSVLIEWLKEHVSPDTGRLSTFTNEEAAASLGMQDLQRNGRVYGNIQSRIDFACYRAGLPPLGLAALAPFPKAWSSTGYDWDFPVPSMQLAAHGRAWSDEDFDRIQRESESLPGQAWMVWQEAMTVDEERVRKWAFGLTDDSVPVDSADGADWSDDELRASVVAYLEMANLVGSGVSFVKKHYYEALAARFGRTVKAFEFRMQNISAVMDELGMPWLPGLKPAANVGANVKPRLIAMVLEQLGRADSNSVVEALAVAAEEAEASGAFSAKNVEDARQRVLAGIVRRRGQPAFRKALIEAYGGACAITGCTLIAILEAAHVHPYMGDHTNVVSNGLLLRTDIHTLFDLRLIAINPETLTVLVSPDLNGTEYEALRDRSLYPVKRPTQQISADALAWHRSRCAFVTP